MGLSVGSRVYDGCVSGVGYLCAVGYLEWCSADGCVGGLFFLHTRFVIPETGVNSVDNC